MSSISKPFTVKYLCITILCVGVLTVCSAQDNDEWEHSPSYREWFQRGRAELREALVASRNRNERLAKNVILFIGDGMGISTVTASRIRQGQLRGQQGEENVLSFERFPHVGLIKTYSVDSQVTDSAAAGTGMLTGVKVNSGVLGCDSRVAKGNCSLYGSSTRLKTILHRFMDEGASTGIVTNSRLTHATPAAAYAQSPHREWEGDVDLPHAVFSREEAENDEEIFSGDGEIGCIDGHEGQVCGRTKKSENLASCSHVDDIAKQLIMDNPKIKVLLGGGRRYFLDNTTVDPETGAIGAFHRRDGLNLIDEWQKDKNRRNVSAHYTWNKDQFDKVNPHDTDYLLGIFNPSHLAFDSEDENRTQPNLVEMTKKAIQILQKDSKGFFLLVEGARIDFGHHANSASTAMSETLELDQAVAEAVKLTSQDQDTLIIVTADHSHAFSIQGYAPRGSDILGKARPSPDMSPLDGVPYTTLGYGNGPSYGRHDITGVDTTSPNYRQAGCVPLSTETHAGEDVSVYARGPMAHLFHTTHEQSFIYHAMEYAACVGRSKKYCSSPQRD